MGKIVLLLVLFLFLSIEFTISKKQYRILLEKFVCEHSEYCSKNSTCSVKMVRRGVLQLSYYSVLSKDINVLWVRIVANYKDFDTYRPSILDIPVDYCAFMAGHQENALLKLVIENMKNYTKNLHPCPFKFGEPLEVKEFQMDTAVIPMSIPTGSYRVDIHLWNGQKTNYLKAFIYLSVKNLVLKSKNKNNKKGQQRPSN